MSLAEAAAAAVPLGAMPLGRARARAGGFHGVHPRRRAGTGSDFWQYRQLEPGEAVDRVDWRRSARSDGLYVREREREDAVRLWLWVDGSGSMDFASARGLPTKAARARVVAGALALAAHTAGEQVAMLGDGPARSPEALFARLGTSGGGLPPASDLRPGDAVVAVGDFLDGGMREWAARAAAQGAVGTAIAVADRAEANFPYSGRVRFAPAEPEESERDLAQADALHERYLAAWAEHRKRFLAVSAVGGWLARFDATDTVPTETLRAAADWLRG